MLPPLIPINAVPVTSQLDPPKQAPVVPPVVPAQPSQHEGSVDLRNRDSEERAVRLREEHRRQQQRHGQDAHDNDDEYDGEDGEGRYRPEPGAALNADNTVPVAPLIEGETRAGLLVDIEV